VTPYLLKRSVSSPKRNNLQRAVGLLGLQTRDYPPVTADGPQPRLDLVRGQVTVTVEETPRRTSASAGSSSRKNSTPGGSLRDRAEFLAIIEFDVPVSTRVQGTDAAFLASIPVPRCLDNLLRLQLPCDSDSEASVSIEPKVLPNPRRDEADPFRSRVATGNRIEDGWEDGEVPGAESDEASEDDDDEGGSWVEGRFPRYAYGMVLR
jgi:hypothetical protein